MARATQSQLSSGLSTAGEHDGPSAFPGGHFLLLDPNPYWASTLCLSREDLLEKLIPAMGHDPIVVDLPIPEEE